MPLKPSQTIISRQRDRRSAYDAAHGLHEHELELYAVNVPPGFDGSQTTEPLPTLIHITPAPRILDRGVDTITERESGGVEATRVQKYEVSQVSRNYSDSDLRPLYWLVVPADVAPLPADVRDRKYPRYRLLGTPKQLQDQWTLTLVEER
jgi:hypothetical protein